jgi:hypothetical protein
MSDGEIVKGVVIVRATIVAQYQVPIWPPFNTIGGLPRLKEDAKEVLASHIERSISLKDAAL